MPELPDLEAYSKNLKTRVLNKKIISADVFGKPNSTMTDAGAKQSLVGAAITDIKRDGKELFFRLENGNIFGVHLMLKGRFDICPAEEISLVRYRLFALGFEDGSALVVSDANNYCKISLNPTITTVPDALGRGFTEEYFVQAIKKNSRKNIKLFLTSQSVVKGIGNAYVDEILWKAGVSPDSTAGKIPDEYVKAIYEAIPFVLKDAIANIERLCPDTIGGEERSFLRVHNPRKKYTDEGEEILVKKGTSSYTYYTARQRLFI